MQYLHLAPDLHAMSQSIAEVGLVLSSGDSSGGDVRQAALAPTERDLTDRDTPLQKYQRVLEFIEIQMAYP